ncbi:hypothetical protein SCLCIDRAFT_101552 [Scleroderma citrinum Foug A]|uniref:Uncharacterized protein n=1 Tax=Scleroderma citrinum Foug A TaxID=1036808 RepID=A0A0C3ENY6_9AGAM|nr:hypothetical protein SCLCIDRAFT_101552 [Scleroderma citrinum Foug A]
MIQEGLEHINKYLTDLAAFTGQLPQQIIDCFLKQYAQLIPTNNWNHYSKYFTHFLDGGFSGTIESTPSVTIRRKCYKLFKKEHPNTWQDIHIKFEDSTHYTETGKTASQWQQLFNKSVKRFTQLFSALSKAHGIEGAFVMVGSIVNQDTSLGHAYTTPSTEDFFMERCHADNNAIIGHFKAHI